MIDRQYYKFDDFTEAHYLKTIQLAKKNYQFISFDEFESNEKCIMLRHDVDFSPQRALKIAELEASQGIASTFFFQVTSLFYSIFEPSIKGIIKRITNLEHRVGLHFDVSCYAIIDKESFLKWLLFEKEILGELINTEVKYFSYHIPNNITEMFMGPIYHGMINAYSPIVNEGFKYISDSNGYWRFERLWDVVESNEFPKLHVLTHPSNWGRRATSPRNRILRCAQGRARSQMVFYDDLLEQYKRKNVGK